MNNNYKEEAKRLSQCISEIRRPDSLVMPIVTDFHMNDLEGETVCALTEALSRITENCRIDGVIALGDNLAMLGRERQAKNGEIVSLIRGLFSKIASFGDYPIFPVNGNHDGIGTDFFDRELWANITEGFDRGIPVREHPKDAYYYVDYPERKLRMAVLSLPSGSDLECEHPTPLWEYGDKQLRWLAGTALDTDFSVLLVAHVPFYYDYHGVTDYIYEVFDGRNKRQTTIDVLCGWIADRKIAEDIFKAFQQHIPYDNEEKNIHLKASKKSAQLIAMLSGHTHSDGLLLPGESFSGESNDGKVYGYVNTLPCIQLISCATDARAAGFEKGLIAIDIAVVTPSERKLSLFRFGEGEKSIRSVDF